MLLVIMIATTLATCETPATGLPNIDETSQRGPTLALRRQAFRDLLGSGTYRATGRMSQRNILDEEQLAGEVEIFSAFDLDKRLFRFDLTEPIIRRLLGDEVPGQEIVKHVRAPDSTINWVNSFEYKNVSRVVAVGIFPPGTKPPRQCSPIEVDTLADKGRDWRQVSGVWVPTKLHVETTSPPGMTKFYDLVIDWVSVNRRVDPVIFTAEGLDVPAGTSITDGRQGGPVFVGQVKGKGVAREKTTYSGIGVSLTCGKVGLVVSIFPGGPAANDGRLEVGDEIIGVERDGQQMTVFQDVDEIAQLLRGPAGTRVKVIVAPKDTFLRTVYELTRQMVEAP